MRFSAVALAAAAALLLAACGSSGGKVSSSSPTSAPATTSPSSGGQSAKPIAMTASSKLGEVLVDSKGMTLYTLTKDGKAVPCTGQCPTFWPPLLVPAGQTSATAPGVANLSTEMTSSGEQVAYRSDPLYRFSMDKAPGDTNGEGINAFGGVWHVVKISASPSTTSPGAGVPAQTPTTTPAGTGYGY